MVLDDAPKRLANTLHFRAFQRSFRVERRIACAVEQFVALPEWDVQGIAKTNDHVPARLRAPGFDEAEVSLRDARRERKGQLALAPSRAPFAQTRAEASRVCGLLSLAAHHRFNSMQRALGDSNDLQGNCDLVVDLRQRARGRFVGPIPTEV